MPVAEKIASGFEFTEGPVWYTNQDMLVFSDIIGNTLYRWSESSGVAVLRRPSHMANGNCRDHQGRLLTCEHATSRGGCFLLRHTERGAPGGMLSVPTADRRHAHPPGPADA